MSDPGTGDCLPPSTGLVLRTDAEKLAYVRDFIESSWHELTHLPDDASKEDRIHAHAIAFVIRALEAALNGEDVTSVNSMLILGRAE